MSSTVGVGQVQTHNATIALPQEGLKLERGGVLKSLDIAYECYGELNANKDNVVYICTALTGDAHAAGYHEDPATDKGWWDAMIGPGRGIDTDYYHVVCANILGGCKGTTGPASINPDTGNPYGADFPEITVADIIDVHMLLLTHLGIDHLAAVVGGSFGGMQVLEWAVRFPDVMDRCICIATAPCLSAQALAFDSLARRMILDDEDWQEGHYYETGQSPKRGLGQARQLGHITYLSQEIMMTKFGRERRITGNQTPINGFMPLSEFEVASYLDYQAEKFVQRFDANSYLRIMHAMDNFDLKTRNGQGLEDNLKRVKAKTLIVAVSSDWLFPPSQSKEIANAMLRAGKAVSYCLLDAPYGHDAFLVDIDNLVSIVKAFLPWVAKGDQNSLPEPALKPMDTSVVERDAIPRLIEPGSKVLDVGCGDGALLAVLDRCCQASGIGIDIDFDQVVNVLNRGYDIFQEDVDAGLAMIPDNMYDYAILSETLQVVRHPRAVMKSLLRVAREGIVSFPNFACYSLIAHLLLRGRMPVGRSLPFEWYNTPNIHLFTLKDFEQLCNAEGWHIKERVVIYDSALGRLLGRVGLVNYGASRILIKVSR